MQLDKYHNMNRITIGNAIVWYLRRLYDGLFKLSNTTHRRHFVIKYLNYYLESLKDGSFECSK